ncbi:MAG: YdgA family protein [Deltaproteobacteria bacterium]|jgi:hypothetical protein|nr:YdgA family protein [Deltaproteobacteria bacterium]MCW8893462.1 YdgA family protein [Deltaproteobacteria bacterium]MCW9049118.1 YdgA family protein [Deltaproteobacteria bacterium]
MLRKVLSTLMVLIIIALFALTWYSSQTTEKLFTEQVEVINRAYPQLLEIKIDQYQRKLFTSQARTTVKMPEQEIALNHQIRHFIWGLTITSTLAEGSEFSSAIVQQIPLEQLALISQVNFKGDISSRFSLPEGKFTLAGQTIAVTGLALGWEQGDELSAGQAEFRMEQLALGVDQRRTELSDVLVQSNSVLTEDNCANTTSIRFSRLLLAEEELLNGQMTFSLADISMKALRALQNSALEVQAQGISPQPSSMSFQLLGLYSELLQSGLSLRLEELSLETAEGKMNAAGALIFEPTDEILAALLTLSHISAQLQIKLDSDVFKTGYRLLNRTQDDEQRNVTVAVLNKEAGQVARDLVQKGIFVEQPGSDQFSVNFSLSEGQAILNGKALN